MRRTVLGIVLTMLATVPLHAGTSLSDGPHVVVSGEGKVTAKPDRARITLSVNARDSNAAVVKQRVDQAVNGLLDVLKKRRIPASDVSASALSVNEDFDYENNRRVSRGFRGARSVDFKTSDLAGMSALIDGGLAAGMNEVGSIRFESSNEAALRMDARSRAAAQSRERGEELAKAYGASLGKIYSINSTGSNVLNRYGVDLESITVTGSRAAAAPPAAPGQYIEPSIEFNERVQVVFDLIR